MEIRKESLSALKLCRFCLTQDDTLTSLYESNRGPKNSVTLQLKILSGVSVEVFPSDKMLTFICNRCKFFMGMSYAYKQICRQADEVVLQYIQHGTPLTPVPWPKSLTEMLHSDDKSSPVGMIQVIGGDDTIQMTTQDDSDEDDDENTYDIKIEDISEDGPKNAHVNIIASAKKQARNPKKGKDWMDAESAVVKDGGDGGVEGVPADEVREETGAEVAAGRFACDECERSYPLQQLLELHKQQKHKSKMMQCNKCNAKFSRNSDLLTHQLQHTEEMLFQCVACDKKFKHLIGLKRHEKIVHADIPQLPCVNCPATFLSLEELEEHRKKHTYHAERRYICPICNKRFLERGTLQRHKEIVHDKKAEFSCEYCPLRFTTVSKLTRHVRAHAGERAYPCKYCDKSFMKSHHYTRHLRLKHQGNVSTCRGPFGESEQFRCEQCEDSFVTQDELIYHSAIHATQNLTCPLCQEKFHDVDAVTAHIKSHVNGMEFMCDMCELVFTSKEKLYNHIAVAHEDEMRNSEDLGQDESSMEMDAEEDEDDNTIHVKEEDGHMVVEIKQPGEFMISNLPQGETEEKNDNTISEESETDADFATVDMAAITRTDTAKPAPAPVTVPAKFVQDKSNQKNDIQTASILRKAEEIKRKVGKQQATESNTDKKEKSNSKPEGNTAGASDKSLRLLEKELQELKRTNTRNEVVKTPSKPVEMLRNRRPQLHTSTPKLRSAEEKKNPPSNKPPAPEKKVAERRAVTKENKEPKEAKDTKGTTSAKDDKEVKEKETPKGVVKNGTSDKSGSEEGIRRSTRPSKIRDYAKMIRDRSQDTEDDEEEDSDDSDEYKEEDILEVRPKQRRSSIKPVPKAAQVASATPATPARKRGRPRKDAAVPSKMKKDMEDDDARAANTESDSESTAHETTPTVSDNKKATPAGVKLDTNKPIEQNVPTGGIIVSPTGQTLKKIPIKALPPGVKPMPLPVNARPVGSGEVCEMQIGKKMVKVQKIVMTKAEVEAMAKKGLVEMKDGTMVLKQGIKLATGLNNRPVGVGEESTKESPTKKATPTRCDLGDA